MVFAGDGVGPGRLRNRRLLPPPGPGDEGDAARLDDRAIAEPRQDEGEIRRAAADQRGKLRRRREGTVARQPPRRRGEALDAVDAQDAVAEHGMALDSAGNLYVAHVGNGCVWSFSPLGHPIHRIVSCTGLSITNMAFGGKDNSSLFITESETGTILRAELSFAGKQMYSHA